MSKSRSGALQTSPVLQADKIPNLASQQCLISLCCSLRSTASQPTHQLSQASWLRSISRIHHLLFYLWPVPLIGPQVPISKYSSPYHNRYVESSCLAAWDWSRVPFSLALCHSCWIFVQPVLKASSDEQNSASSSKSFQSFVIFPR